jgi:hypothetical protein
VVGTCLSFQSLCEWRASKSKKDQIGVFLGCSESTERGDSKGTEGQTEEWEALKLSVKAANVPKCAHHGKESIWD